MNTLTRERLAETAAASAVIAVLATAVCLGALFLDRHESKLVSAQLLPLAEQNLQLRPGSRLVQKDAPAKPTSVVRRAFRYEDKQGNLVGAGLSVRVAFYDWDKELLVLTDEKGRVRTYETRIGAPGVVAEEFETYILSRRKGSASGLDATVDIASWDSSVAAALAEASRFVRSWTGGAE